MGRNAQIRRQMKTATPTPINTRSQVLVIPVDFANKVIGYLATQPYGNVAQLMDGFGRLAREQGFAPQPGPAPEPPKDAPENG